MLLKVTFFCQCGVGSIGASGLEFFFSEMALELNYTLSLFCVSVVMGLD